jgi:hypothetical protein
LRFGCLVFIVGIEMPGKVAVVKLVASSGSKAAALRFALVALVVLMTFVVVDAGISAPLGSEGGIFCFDAVALVALVTFMVA